MWSNSVLASLIEPDRVKRDIYTNPELFELELQRIFGHAWLYLGHESQIREQGDFFLTRLGRDKVIVARHDDGAVHAFFNRCTHRGAEVCSEPAGHVQRFVCPYHAWSFRTDGSLDGIPHAAAGYGDAFARKLEGQGLERVARVESYRGFIFGRRCAEGPDLVRFLGPEVQAVFDNFIDRAPGGALEVAGGKLVQAFRANWKFQIENSIDLLHPSILHRNAIDAANAHRLSDDIDPGARIAIELNGQNMHPFRDWDAMGVHALDNGHCFMGTFFKKEAKRPAGAAQLGSDDAFRFAALADYKAALIARHGPDKTEAVLGFARHNTIVYPNLFVNPRIQQVRVLHPVAVDRTEQHCQVMRFVGAPDDMHRVAIRILTASNSPASLATSDDHEIFEQMQRSLASGERPWLDFARSYDPADERGGHRRAPGTSELPMRNQHRAWLDYMTRLAA